VAKAATDTFVKSVEALQVEGKVSGDPIAHVKRGADTVDKINAFHNEAMQEMRGHLVAREDKLTRQRAVQAGLSAVGVLLALYVAAAINFSIRRSANALQRGASQVAAGELAEVVTVAGRDEFAQVAESFDRARETLNKLIAEMNHMSAEHERGDIDVVIDSQNFQGDYRTMAQNVNDMVGAHIAVKKMALGVVAEFGRGNYDAPLDKLPGKKAFINDTIEQVRVLLRDAATAAQENQRIRLALDGVPSSVMIADKDGRSSTPTTQ
jgi:methyl-accepting chemotaxis protein